MLQNIKKVKWKEEAFHCISLLTKLPHLEDHFVVTQNWDGQLGDYGIDPQKIWEIYGSISHYQRGEEIVEEQVVEDVEEQHVADVAEAAAEAAAAEQEVDEVKQEIEKV